VGSVMVGVKIDDQDFHGGKALGGGHVDSGGRVGFIVGCWSLISMGNRGELWFRMITTGKKLIRLTKNAAS
jgi:hypothetical protein